MKTVREIFGNNLRKYRTRCGLSIAELARRIDQEPASISRYEIAERFPKAETIGDLARALQVNEADFFREDDAPVRASPSLEKYLRDENETLAMENKKLASAFRSSEKLLKSIEDIYAKDLTRMRLARVCLEHFAKEQLLSLLNDAEFNSSQTAKADLESLGQLVEGYIRSSGPLRAVLLALATGNSQAIRQLEQYDLTHREVEQIGRLVAMLRSRQAPL